MYLFQITVFGIYVTDCRQGNVIHILSAWVAYLTVQVEASQRVQTGDAWRQLTLQPSLQNMAPLQLV